MELGATGRASAGEGRQGVDTKVTCGEWGLRGHGDPADATSYPGGLECQLTHPASSLCDGEDTPPSYKVSESHIRSGHMGGLCGWGR